MPGAVQPVKKKSGIRTYKPGDILFNENDPANSLFIIQSGQIRLYRPKGRGFIEIAILRSGEVIGEMAYFDEKTTRRSCSAAAIVTTEVIEISFTAFEQTMKGLNPWFKTIINTLADRLRKTNERVKNLESNSVGFGAGGKVSDYVFFHNADVIKMLSTVYLAMRVHGEQVDGITQIHMNKLRFYLFDVYNCGELKWEEFQQLLKTEHFIEIGNDEDGLPKIVKVADLDRFRSMVVFFNTQRVTDDAKKLKISSKCERFLKRIIEQLTLKGLDKPSGQCDISIILDDFKSRSVPINEDDLRDAVAAGLSEDILVGEGNKLSAVIHYEKLKTVFPSIKMLNAVAKLNDVKSGKKYADD